MAFSYVHQIKDLEKNLYNVTDQRLYSDDNDETEYKNIQLTTPTTGTEPNLLVRGDVYINNISQSTAHKLLWQVSSSTDIVDGVVITPHISNSAITTSKIADSSITEAKISDSAVTANKIANTAVTETKIGTGAVTTSKISDGAVTLSKLDSTAYVVQQNPVDSAFNAAYRILVSPDISDDEFSGVTSKATGLTYNPNEMTLNASGLKVIASGVETSYIFGQGGMLITSDGDLSVSGDSVTISANSQITIPGYATESWVSSQGFVTQASLASYATTSYVDDRVVANPTEAASVQLSKIKVGGSVFYIPEGGGGGGGTSNYADLENKPQINGFTLVGNVTTSQILSAGSGISISGSIISATAIYSAGSHISISSNNVISATYEPATTLNPGLIKLGSDTPQTTSANSVTSDAGRTYAIQCDESGQAVVNVPFSMPSSVSTALITPDLNEVLSIYAETGEITIQTEDQGGHTGGFSFSGAEIYHMVDGQRVAVSLTDTKNTAGATQTASKIYLVGATSQSTSIQTYTNSSVYAQDGQLYVSGYFHAGNSSVTYMVNSTEAGVYMNAQDVYITTDDRAQDEPRIGVKYDSTASTTYPYVENQYLVINGIRVYVASSAPTGSIPAGSLGIGW